jgi:hypothetical protein
MFWKGFICGAIFMLAWMVLAVYLAVKWCFFRKGEGPDGRA